MKLTVKGMNLWLKANIHLTEGVNPLICHIS